MTYHCYFLIPLEITKILTFWIEKMSTNLLLLEFNSRKLFYWICNNYLLQIKWLFKTVYKKKLFILSSALLCYIVSDTLKQIINKHNRSSLKRLIQKRSYHHIYFIIVSWSLREIKYESTQLIITSINNGCIHFTDERVWAHQNW